jgi:hypothetical protein
MIKINSSLRNNQIKKINLIKITLKNKKKMNQIKNIIKKNQIN